jgi:dTDP-4-amino-4,6-dideoxygalactose transaminase
MVYTPALISGTAGFDEKIQFYKPSVRIRDCIDQVVRAVSRGDLSGRSHAAEFEERCCAYLGAAHAIALSSCTSGLMVLMKALKLDGEVIVPGFTFGAPLLALEWCGLNYTFVDVEEDTFNIDPGLVDSAVSRKTAAILAVSTFGNPAAVDSLQRIATKNNIPLLLDSAQSFGSLYDGRKMGSFGHAEAFSLSPAKAVTACEGGVITTSDDMLAERIRIARNYGQIRENRFHPGGLSSRFSEVHAIIGMASLDECDVNFDLRRKIDGVYRKGLFGIPGIELQVVRKGNRSNCNYVPIKVDPSLFGLDRNELQRALSAENIETKRYFYPLACTQQAFEKGATVRRKQLPVSEELSESVLCLPIYPSLPAEIALSICDIIRSVFHFREEVKKVIASDSSLRDDERTR